jgi:hypothetical protein
MDDALADADPIVQVAIMDAYYEMTEDRYHQQDLECILAKAAKGGDANEELYMAARLALGRVNGLAKDALGEYYDSVWKSSRWHPSAQCRESVESLIRVSPS